MKLFTIMNVRIIFIIFLLSAAPTEVNADQARTALIASGCVAGGLLVAAVAFGAIYCFIRHKRRAEKKPLPRYSDESSIPNGVYRPERTLQRTNTTNGQPPDLRQESKNLGSKALTQHAVSPRQRPSVPFYTVRADSRRASELPGVVHMGPPVYSRPPQIGRPVIFLDMNGTSKSKANGGPIIRRGSANEDRARRSSRVSRNDRKERSRSQSRSRSREPRTLTRRHSDTFDTSIFGVSGNVILQKKMEDNRNYSRGSKQSRQDTNNNPFMLYVTNNITDMQSTNLGNHTSIYDVNEFSRNNKYIAEEGRYSVIQVNSANKLLKTSHGNQIIYQEREGVIAFGDEDEGNAFTPRIDYPTNSPRSSDILLVPHADVAECRSFINIRSVKIDGAEEIPKADYMHEVTTNNQKSENFQIKGGEIDDIIALSLQSSYYSRCGDEKRIPDHPQNEIVTRAQPLTSPARPLTPPFDGVELVLPLFTIQHHEETVSTYHKSPRVPTPPPDMSPDKEDNHLSGFVFPPPPPPPPPLPPPSLIGGAIKQRPATPPPGMIKLGQNLDFRDILNPRKQHSASSENISSQKVAVENREGGLPFMEELKRRQRSFDDGVVRSPLQSITCSSTPQRLSPLTDNQRSGVVDNLSNGSAVGSSQRSDLSKNGLPHRTSVVQFADNPPEIIPQDDVYRLQRCDGPDKPKDIGPDTTIQHPQIPSSAYTVR